jgi:hypothetical protein
VTREPEHWPIGPRLILAVMAVVLGATLALLVLRLVS